MYTQDSKEEIDRKIQTIRRVTDEACKSKESAREFLDEMHKRANDPDIRSTSFIEKTEGAQSCP